MDKGKRTVKLNVINVGELESIRQRITIKSLDDMYGIGVRYVLIF